MPTSRPVPVAAPRRRPAAPIDPSLTPALPRALQLEVTAACNFRCRMCLVRYREPVPRTQGTMSLRDVEALLDELPGLERVTLQGLGEPLLVPDLVAMVRAVRVRGARVGFNTNGSLLTHRKADELLDADLSWLCVSLDGATPDTLRAIRDGADFARIVANLRGFAARRRAHPRATTDLSVVFVAMRRNIDELPALVDLVADCGVEALRVQNLSHTFDDCDPSGGYAEIRAFAAREAIWDPTARARADEVMAEAARRAARRGVALRLPEDPDDEAVAGGGDVACNRPWREAYVTHDGGLQPCCMVMGSDRVRLGELRDAPFGEHWHADAYRAFRASLLPGASPHEVCAGCSVYHHRF